jgi:beta-barrel assembly-enhancing protease
MTKSRSIQRVCSLLTVWLLLAGSMLAQSGPQLPDPGNAPISRDQQVQLGFQAASEVYKQMPVLPDNSPETRYIRQIGQRLAATIPQEYSWPFEFHTIAEKEINAFALPGGPMFVNVGSITAAANEAELAGVMAHEMAHVYMQHSAKQIQKQQTTQIFAGILGAVLGARGGALGQLAQAGVQIGAGTLMMKYSRGDESQADAVGTMILYRAGYNPRALADFFQKLEEEGGGRGPQFLSDHPNPGNREQAILKEIQSWPPKQYRGSSSDFQRVRADARNLQTYSAQEIADGAKSGRWAKLNQQNGAVFKAPPGVKIQPTAQEQGGPQPSGPQPSGPAGATPSVRDIMPSSRMVSENLGPLSIARPENWDVIGPQQQGASVTIAPRAGVAGNGIGYGVVINGVAANQVNSGDLSQVTMNIARSLQSNGDLQPIGDPQQISVNGAEGRSLMMESTSPFAGDNGGPQKERDWLVTAGQPDGSVVFFVFVSPQQDFRHLQPTFESMLRSVRFSQ